MSFKDAVMSANTTSAARGNVTTDRKRKRSTTTATPTTSVRPRLPSQHASLIQSERSALPIAAHRADLLHSITQHPVTIVSGSTGSGKTTQLPQFLVDSGRFKSVIVTQPRRVATVSVANRVAAERSERIGGAVGYMIRFDTAVSAATRITYATDGMLMRCILTEPLLSSYDVVIVDECHERTVMTDVICAVLKTIQTKRAVVNKPLQVVLMSATMQTDVFSAYFNGAPVISISGRQYDVDIRYTAEPQADYIDSAIATVMTIHNDESINGDVLIFLSGAEEIESAKTLLLNKRKELKANARDLQILPLYAQLTQESQLAVFAPTPPHTRKIILSTNIAETSVTLPNIHVVIDCGVTKIKVYDENRSTDKLMIVSVSQSEALQRAGRAGRQSNGICFRMYTAATYATLPVERPPEINRINLAHVVLLLKALRVDDIHSFQWITPPKRTAIQNALVQLQSLTAIARDGTLTDLGRSMAKFPLAPHYAKAIIMASQPMYSCSEEMITLISMLSVESVLIHPASARSQPILSATRRTLSSKTGDHLTLIACYNAYAAATDKSSLCHSQLLNAKSMHRVSRVREQLISICQSLKLAIVSCGDELANVLKCLVTSHSAQCARLRDDGTYQSLVNPQTVYIHPTSTLFHTRNSCLLYDELVASSKRYMRTVSAIEYRWIEQMQQNRFHGKLVDSTTTSAVISEQSKPIPIKQNFKRRIVGN